MFGYVVRRLIAAIPIALGVSMVCYALVYLAPGEEDEQRRAIMDGLAARLETMERKPRRETRRSRLARERAGGRTGET